MLDVFIIEIDKILRNLTNKNVSRRVHPDQYISEVPLSIKEHQQVVGMMRINHCGEICAQGLYQGQILMSRDINHKKDLLHAASEEVDHLAWTECRLIELQGKTTIFNPLFYLASLTIGITAGMCGDNINLGFLAATEYQVAQHLQDHLQKIPEHDNKSKAILEQMLIDETAHADMAIKNGAIDLPKFIKLLMKLSSRIMTTITYRI